MLQNIIVSLLLNFAFSFYCIADQFNLDVGTGYEKVTSPLVRIDLEGPLILVDGRSQLAGQFYQVKADSLKDWDIGSKGTFNLSANLDVKDSPKAQGLNFSTASLEAVWRKELDHFNLSFGPTIQRVWVANARFRDNVCLQTDLTYVKDKGTYSNLYMALSKNYYVEDFEFMDSKAITVSLTHHINEIAFGFTDLDLQLSATRDKNIADSNDLSNYAYYGSVSIDRKMLGLTWSFVASMTQSYFDEPFFDGFAKRRDRYISYEIDVERKLTDQLSLNLAINTAENYSNLALFQSDYQLINLTLNYTY